nr:tyrosine-type recombinase/integrase [Vibrio parahaemolyticus]
MTLLSPVVIAPLKLQIQKASSVQKIDNEQGIGPSLPHTFGKKYPKAFQQIAWMFIFPSTTICRHPLTNQLCRHHLLDSAPRKALKHAVQRARLFNKRVTCHTFRHSFATELLRSWTGHPYSPRAIRTFRCSDDTNLNARYWRTFCGYCKSTK